MIELMSEPAKKCIADGIFGATGSDGPDGPDATVQREAFRRVRKADQFNLAGETNEFPRDFNRIAPLTLQMFVAGDCDALTPDRKSELWDDALKTARRYWEHEPTLPNPFPKDKFPEPEMDCENTRIADLSVTLQDQWSEAQQ